MRPIFFFAGAALAIAAGLTQAPAQNGALPQETLEILMEEGGRIYRTKCARCHGDNGEGQRFDHGAAPRLSGNRAHLAVEQIVPQIICGGAYMPPFGDLTDREIAAVASYVRNSFGNERGMVTEAEIAPFR